MFSISILAAVLIAAEAAAPVAAPVVTPPQWRRIPTLDEMADRYPDQARLSGIEGQAVLTCAVSVSGRLEACSVQSETPPELGFGEAALAISPLFEVSPKRIDGKAVGALVTFPIVFKLPFDRQIGLDEAVRCYGLLSVHLQLAPSDAMLVNAVGQARARAEFLAKSRVGAADLERRLASAIDRAPRPLRAGATRDVCFQLFL